TGGPGDKVRVGTELLVLDVDGDGERLAPEPAASRPAETPAAQPPQSPRPKSPEPPVAARSSGGKPLASAARRQRAHGLGIGLGRVAGTGPGGRVSHADLDGHIAEASRPAPVAMEPAYAKREAIEEIKVIGLRRRIAERMQESKRHIPHYSYVEELDMTAAEELRTQLNARHRNHRPHLTVLPFLIRAMALAIPRCPQLNARFDDEAGVVR